MKQRLSNACFLLSRTVEKPQKKPICLSVALLALIGMFGGTVAREARAFDLFQISTDGKSREPSVSGSIVVWEGDGWGEIDGMNLATGERFVVFDSESFAFGAQISGTMVVWQDIGEDFHGNIYGKDLAVGEVFPIAVGPGVFEMWPAISGSNVVWTTTNSAPNYQDIVARTPVSGDPFYVSSAVDDQRRPAISGNTVVWMEMGMGTNTIWAKQLPDGTPLKVGDNAYSDNGPRIDGDVVVWVKSFSESGIWARRLDDDAAFRISAVNSQQYSPAISGDIVVWSDNRNGQYDIYGKNLLTGLEFPIAVGPGDKWCPAIDGNLVVWHRFLEGRLDIWGTVIPEPATAILLCLGVFPLVGKRRN